jgi:hypothetical protein
MSLRSRFGLAAESGFWVAILLLALCEAGWFLGLAQLVRYM